MSAPGDKVLQAYIRKFGSLPDQANQLVSYSRTDVEIPTIIYSEAKKALGKIKKSIKSGKIKKKSFKTSTKWSVGDEVLISKDRTGFLKYIGKVPEMGDDKIYYGLELTSGTLGQNDGAVKGKRYFQTTGKRGMFIPEKKLRRKLNKKDKERRNSYAEVSTKVKELQKDYAGDDAQWLYHGNNPSNNDNPNLHTLVFETAEPDEYSHGNGQQRRGSDSTDGTDEMSPKINKRAKEEVRRRSNTGGSIHKKKRKKSNEVRRRSNTSGSSRRNSRNDGSDESVSEESEVSELDETETKHDPTVKTFDTVLKYILRQKGQYRDGLLDVYANPQTHSLIVEAFSQMKQLQPAEQAFLWPALLKRWSRYTHKI